MIIDLIVLGIVFFAVHVPIFIFAAGRVDSFTMEPDAKVIVHINDFCAALNLAERSGADVTARSSTPTRPVKFDFQVYGLVCEFLFTTTMTVPRGVTQQCGLQTGATRDPDSWPRSNKLGPDTGAFISVPVQ